MYNKLFIYSYFSLRGAIPSSCRWCVSPGTQWKMRDAWFTQSTPFNRFLGHLFVPWQKHEMQISTPFNAWVVFWEEQKGLSRVPGILITCAYHFGPFSRSWRSLFCTIHKGPFHQPSVKNDHEEFMCVTLFLNTISKDHPWEVILIPKGGEDKICTLSWFLN